MYHADVSRSRPDKEGKTDADAADGSSGCYSGGGGDSSSGGGNGVGGSGIGEGVRNDERFPNSNKKDHWSKVKNTKLSTLKEKMGVTDGASFIYHNKAFSNDNNDNNRTFNNDNNRAFNNDNNRAFNNDNNRTFNNNNRQDFRGKEHELQFEMASNLEEEDSEDSESNAGLCRM